MISWYTIGYFYFDYFTNLFSSEIFMPKQELNPCPKVSVVLPMYNADAYVGQAIESILNQTLTLSLIHI